MRGPGNRTGSYTLTSGRIAPCALDTGTERVSIAGAVVVKLGGFVGATVAGYVGWYLVAGFGFMTAFIVSTIASGFGMYYGAKFARKYAP